MKMKPLFTAMLAVMFLGFTACKSSQKDMLAQKWKPTDISGPGMTDDVKAKALAGDNSMEFMKDGSFVNNTAGKPMEKGVYTLSDDGKTITLNPTGGTSESISVKELSKDKMVGEMTGTTVTFTPYNK